MLVGICFYLIAFVTVFASSMVVFSRNPVHSVLWLIFVFLNSAALFVILGAEFLAMILIIVYVGAVAVLFMFVVMMLNVNVSVVKEGVLQYLPAGGLMALVLLGEFIFVSQTFPSEDTSQTLISRATIPNVPTNTEALGDVLYTEYFYLFQVAGLVLLVAMIGAIVLTLRERTGVRRQNPNRQSERTKKEAIEIKKIEPKSGVL